MIRLLIADDHAVVRHGLRQIAEQITPISIGEASNGIEVLRLVQQEAWTGLVLDISMPGGDGLEVLQRIRHLQPKLPILILSLHSEDQYGIRVLKAGASGFINKARPPEEILLAIQKVIAGERYISTTLAERLFMELAEDQPKTAHEILSNREYQVLLLMGSGKSLKQTAAELALSIKTIGTYRERLLEKLKLRNTADLIRYVIEQQLL